MKLRTILVDDEPWCMEQFEMECTDTNIELLGKFESAKEHHTRQETAENKT